METLLHDFRFALRMLARNRGFAAIAILILALGIGANTAVFSVMDAAFLRSLPVPEPQRLVLFHHTNLGRAVDSYGYLDSSGSLSFSGPVFARLRARNRSFANVFGFAPLGFGRKNLTARIQGPPSMVDGVMVTGGYFSGLGVHPLLGRTITETDERQAASVAIISYAYWTRAFDRNPAAVGRTIFLNHAPYAIVGVAPRGFLGVMPGRSVDVWIPLVATDSLSPWSYPAREGTPLLTDAHRWWLMVMGRLKPGVTRRQALAETQPLFEQCAASQASHAAGVPTPRLVLTTGERGLSDVFAGDLKQPLLLLLLVAAMVLLLACANVAALLLERAAARQKEIALRLALGISRARLGRQLLTESVLLSSAGAALGLLFAWWGSRVLLKLIVTSGNTLSSRLALDLPVLAFTAAAALTTGILFGLAPAWRSTRVEIQPALQQTAGRIATPGSKLGNTFVVFQIALSLLLVVGAGLFVRTLENLESVRLGFNPSHLLLFRINAKSGAVAPYQQFLDRLRSAPGVRAASYSLPWPSLSGVGMNVSAAGPAGTRKMVVETCYVGPSFFKAMGMPVLAGRGIEWRDAPKSTRVVVVSQSATKELFGRGSPLGLNIHGWGNLNFEVVGVVPDARFGAPGEAPTAIVFVPYAQVPLSVSGWQVHFEVRTAGNPGSVVSAVRKALHETDPDLPLAGAITGTEMLRQDLSEQRMFAQLCSFFGLLALGLAAIGLAGVLAYAVRQRTRELGVRMALGATPGNISRMVLGQCLRLALPGVAIGLAASYGLTRLIANRLYGVKPTDPATIGAAAAILVAASLLAAYLPARRASRVDPETALRHE